MCSTHRLWLDGAFGINVKAQESRPPCVCGSRFTECEDTPAQSTAQKTFWKNLQQVTEFFLFKNWDFLRKQWSRNRSSFWPPLPLLVQWFVHKDSLPLLCDSIAAQTAHHRGILVFFTTPPVCPPFPRSRRTARSSAYLPWLILLVCNLLFGAGESSASGRWQWECSYAQQYSDINLHKAILQVRQSHVTADYPHFTTALRYVHYIRYGYLDAET